MKNLYVGNLPHSTTEAELRNVFEPHGAVEKVTLVTDRETGRSRGFGFVEMTNATEADKAIAALNGTDLGGRLKSSSEITSAARVVRVHGPGRVRPLRLRQSAGRPSDDPPLASLR